MYGLNIDPKNEKGNPDPGELRGLGVEMVRMTYHDHTSGTRLDASERDRQVDKIKRCSEMDIDPLVILTYDTYPDKPGYDDNWDAYIDAFAHRAGQVAKALAKFRPAFQVWNEPDLAPEGQHGEYTPGLRQEVFAQMLRRTHEQIKDVDPDLTVVTGGLASGNPTWLREVIGLLGGDLPADVVAIHTYGQRPDPNWPKPGWAFGYIGDLISIYYRAGGNRPLWITEMGVQREDLGADEEKIAEFLRRFYSAIAYRFSDKVQQLFWFCYSDGMVKHFGLLDEKAKQRPIYNAYREAVATQPKRWFRRPRRLRGADLYFSSPTERELAAIQDQLDELQGQAHQLYEQQMRLFEQLRQWMGEY